MANVWRVEMLGALALVGEDATVTRFRTKRVALLLAYLACFRNRVHFRDEVGELLWPDADPEAARRNLRQALTSLRHVLEPPPLPAGSIVQVQQSRLRLNPELVATDVHEFEQAVADSRRRTDPVPSLQRAVDLYRDEFLPGYREDWVIQERLRLDDLYFSALRGLYEHSLRSGNADEAVHYLRLSLDKDRLNEETHLNLMRQYLATGRPAAALQQFDDLKRQLKEHLREEPSREAYALREKAARASGRETFAVPRREADDVDGPSTAVRLPVHLTRFCGRQEEVSYTLDHLLVRKARLTTLVGPAGTGKTRLSVEVGRRLADSGEWNVWFVPLADVPTASRLMDAVLEAMKARGSSGDDPFERLKNALYGSPNNLLILDNLEHIVEEAVPLVARIADEMPEVQMLVTSRQLLRLGAEHQIEVAPLPVPSDSAIDEPAGLIAYPSVQLFVDRCQVIRPDFQLTANNAKSIATICAKLEGIPLAIELSAGLSGSFTPSQMVLHLDKRLTALASRRRDMPARHRSLRAAIDYSYETLTSDWQRFYAALSVFRGGFKVEAAYEICYRDTNGHRSEDNSVHRHRHDECLDLILELQERSLLRSTGHENDCELGFMMLDSFREYAEEHLSDEERYRLRTKHAAYYRQHPPRLDYPPTTEERAMRHLWVDSEYENYLAAVGFCLAEKDYTACIDLLETLATTWTSRGPRGAERSLIRQVADRLDASIDPNKQILLLRMLGTTHIRLLEYAAAHRACERALAIAERYGLQDQIAVCYTALATCAGYLGNLDECQAMCEAVLRIASEDNLLQRERAWVGLGAVHWGRGDMDAAKAACERGAEYSARLRGGEPDTHILVNLARISLDTGKLDEAMVTVANAMRSCQRVRDDFGFAVCLSLISRYHWLRGNLAAAVATGYEALLKLRDADFAHYSYVGLFQQALVLTSMEEWESATLLLAATQGIGRSARISDERDYEKAIQNIRKHLAAATFERAWARGLAMSVDEAYRLALRYQ